MNTEIPTPETDAALIDMSGNGIAIITKFVDAEFARDLERRLAIEKQRAEQMGKLAHLAACESAELRSRLAIAGDALKQCDPGEDYTIEEDMPDAGVFCELTVRDMKAIRNALTQTAPKL